MSPTPMEETTVVSDVLASLPVTPSATTSRTLLDNEAVRVVVFTFDTGEQLTEHTAAPPVVVQLVQGRMRFQVAGQDHDLAAGDCVYLAPKEPHALEAIEPSVLSLIMLRTASGRE